MAQLHQQGLHELAVDGVIVGHQQSQTRAGAAVARGHGARAEGGRGVDRPGAAHHRLGRLDRRSHRREWQQRGEHAALARLAAHRDVATHHARERARDLQAQAGATEAPIDGFVALAETLEQPRQRDRVHADAGVGDRKTQQGRTRGTRSTRPGRFDAIDVQAHRAGLGELERIADQVEQDLLEALGIGLHPGRHVVGDRHAPLQMFGLSLRAHHRAHVAEHADQRGRFGRDLEPARFELGDVEHVVEDGQQVFARLARGQQVVGLTGVELRALQQRQHAQQAVERRAQLVAHVGQEGALGAAGLLGFEAGLLQIAGQRLEVGAALLQGAQLAHHHHREQQRQQRLEDRQPDRDAVLAPHRLVAQRHLVGDVAVGLQGQLVDLGRQGRHVVGKLAPETRVQRRVGIRADQLVGAFDEGMHPRDHRALVGQQHRQRLGALGLDQADAADEHLVAGLQGGHRLGRGMVVELTRGQAHLLVFAFELVEAPDQVVALVLHGRVEQRDRLPLHPADAREDAEQHQRQQRQPAAQACGATGRCRRRQQGSRWAVHDRGRHSISRILSCQAARL